MQSSWILVAEDGPVWVVNSATYLDDTVPSDALGPFHTRGDAMKAADDLAQARGIDAVYVREVA